MLPHHCILCLPPDKTKLILCHKCINRLPWQSHVCSQCALPLPDEQLDRCAQCLIQPPHYDTTTALFHYATPIAQLIHQLKFHQNISVAALFGKLWVNHLKQSSQSASLPELILPVPLHFKRLKQRGFNQAIEIAKPIAQAFKIPIDTGSCIRIKNAAPQTSLTAIKRKNNLKNTFALSHAIKARHVAILDDVMTTGSTIDEISHLLKASGSVNTVDAWCCARTH